MKTEPYYTDEHLSRATKQFLSDLDTGNESAQKMSIEQQRRRMTSIQTASQVDMSGVTEVEKEVKEDGYNVKMTLMRPEKATGDLPAFFFIHGGGWVSGEYISYRRILKDLVIGSGCTALFVHYTLSPEVKYPEAINELFAAFKWTGKHGKTIGVDSERLALIGNGTGGNMAMALSFLAKENELSFLKLQILLDPVADYSDDHESYRKFGEGRFLTPEMMRQAYNHYVEDPEKINDIYLSPLRATVEEMAGLTPTIIQVAENSILRDEAEELGRKLDVAGVETLTLRYNGAIYDWGVFNALSHTLQAKVLIKVISSLLKMYF